ncbi:Poly(A) polymerase, putative [Phytophthora infestans T30-4]|uniref:Poly(A) polymerase, putative n=2 Tax=Phytophthora infestans TaxID=4787 RepID=D0N3A5_PHYIT|nr:Poly(A) polymerase, putative [Phytophthora infestans T30-4]EEY69397.1 Poly(A) polymerase, putative [Phytophthora infestans T30-4]KAF4042241.1 Zinc knuckle [Phytophthora infestans]KAF4137987.1 Zinc knuckle [Phytophthora infestans]|eukprot:XP_002999251.1 Poly(A) polymerase, putative [Phytophthora infestans T30-4]
MGAANSVRKLTIDSIALLEQLEPNKAELAAKRAVRRRVQQLLQQKWPTCRVLPFGSSESGLGFGGCDVDLGIYFEDVDVDAQGQFSPQERVNLLATACERLSGAFQVLEFVRSARVPVIKLWDTKRQVACDVCVGGINALLNTALLKYYGQVDPRVRPLVFAVKYWAKQRGINDSANGTLSSYGYTLLLIFYLQSHYAEMQLPEVLSLFQDLQSQTKVSVLLERMQAFPTIELPSTFGTSEMNSVGALLAGFFDFYARRFNMEDDVVSIRTGRALSKTTKWSHPVSWRLSIEDPFELAHDVGRVIFHRKCQELIRSEFKRASELLSEDHRLEEICVPDDTSWNIMSTCYICRGRDHATRDCGQLVHQRSTSGGCSNATLHFSDCWYCGEYGHYKAECPMLFFRDIPRPVEMAKADDILAAEATSESDPGPLVGFASASSPIAIPFSPTMKMISPRVCQLRPWEQGLSPHSSPMLRLSRKKKRARHGSLSTSSSSSPVPSLNSPSGGQSQSWKRQQQHRYQQQRHEQRRRNFALLEPTRKCGGNARSGRPYVGKVLCPS